MVKKILVIIFSCQLLQAQSLADDLSKLTWPDEWTYQLKYDPDSGTSFKYYFPGYLTIVNNQTVTWNFHIALCNEKSDFCYLINDIPEAEGEITKTEFGKSVFKYRLEGHCLYDPEHPSIFPFIWKRHLFFPDNCPCMPDKDVECKKLETLLMTLFYYEPGVPHDYIKSMR